MIDRAIKLWKEIIFIFAIMATAFTFYGYRSEAAETQKKVGQFEQTFEKLSQIADDLKDPNVWLRNYLLNHSGVDSVNARIWSNYPKGPVLDTLGNTIPNIPFLEPLTLPEIGVYKLVRSDGQELILDTLWNFESKD